MRIQLARRWRGIKILRIEASKSRDYRNQNLCLLESMRYTGNTLGLLNIKMNHLCYLQCQHSGRHWFFWGFHYSQIQRLSDPTLTSSWSKEMPRLGVGPSGSRCGRRGCRRHQRALQVTARLPPGGPTAPELRPWECAAGLGRCRTSRGRGAGAGWGATVARAAPLLQAPVLHPQVLSARLPHPPPLGLLPSIFCTPARFFRVKNPGGRRGGERAGFLGEPSSVGIGSESQAGLGIPGLESSSSVNTLMLGEAPLSLGLSFPPL